MGETSLRSAKSIGLPDGRTLAYAGWGNADGRPLMLFHGAPGSRLLCPDEAMLVERGLRMIVPDRPGYGNSSAHPGRNLLDWPSDVRALADALGIDRFDLIGWSAGGPHALACALSLPDRLNNVVLVSTNCSAEEVPALLEVRPEMAVVHEGSQTDREGTEATVAAFFQGFADNPQAWYEFVKSTNPAEAVFAEPRWDKNFREHGVEGLRPGSAGYASDQVVCGGPWGFRLSEVTVPITYRYGENDTPMTLASVEKLTTALPHCTASSWPDTGHLGIYTRFAELLDLASGERQ